MLSIYHKVKGGFCLPVFLLFAAVACSEGEEENHTPATVGEITLGATAVSEISRSGARLTSSLTNTSEEAVRAKGFCYSLSSPPTLSDGVVTLESGAADFTAVISGLKSNTAYSVCAYAVTDKQTIYGASNAFRTLADADGAEDFQAPTYADDYSVAGISSWANRNQWNLANVHDPTVEKCGDYYYMYGTDASYGNVHVGRGHFPYRRSKDLVSWDFQGMAMSETPAWVKDTLNSMRSQLGLPAISNPLFGHWAPVVRKVDSKYRMYYCIVVDNYILTGKPNTAANFDNSWTERAFIGLMETGDLGSNLWEDKGMVVCSSTDREKNWARPSLSNWDGYFRWNAIDPSFIVTPEGEHWLIYGSWHSGIVALALDPATGKPFKLGAPWLSAALPDYGSRIYTRNANSRWQGSEAPEVIYNEETGYYYLFLAYDELAVAYNTRACRSRSVAGPYVDFSGRSAAGGISDCKPILTHPYKFGNHSGWVGISHCCIFRGDDGSWYYCSQGRLPENTNGNAYSNAIMMGHVRKIRWTDDGWPVVMPERYAAAPQTPITEEELVGAWENITLKYSYGKQQSAQALTLSASKTASGALSGAWSWDAAAKTLTVGALKLYVEREVDWEASPRTCTIVYAGLNSSGESVWGKKK
ncbi:MAG: arabinan endo-1,5-alpha-L-arabinosidase [Prevotellaceae bacterium]|jgi:arabinan endo-1,5-alpha-L-arabinosidase|nr:arabinan endo-1,5-alpha-L-arabinosidase [Prevotellaceae bacterium]